MIQYCKACGDPVTDNEYRAWRLDRESRELVAGELDYCVECANELYRGAISTRPAKLFSAGHDSKSEPSPWQENAVRSLEGE